MELHELSASQAAARIAAGTMTAEAYAASCLERVAAREPEIHAWACIDAERALKEARSRDREPARGPLRAQWVRRVLAQR